MLENYITQVRRPKCVSSEHEAIVSRAAQASAAACVYKKVWKSLFKLEKNTFCNPVSCYIFNIIILIKPISEYSGVWDYLVEDR